MKKKIDVLAVIGDAAHELHNYRPGAPQPMQEARAALAALAAQPGGQAMRFMIGFDVEIPDAVADQIIRSAGIELDEADYPLALALAVLTPFPSQLRDFLLTPDHTPVPLNSWTLLTTERSAAKVGLMLSTPNEDVSQWTIPNNTSPASSKNPSRKRKTRGTGSGSSST